MLYYGLIFLSFQIDPFGPAEPVRHVEFVSLVSRDGLVEHQCRCGVDRGDFLQEGYRCWAVGWEGRGGWVEGIVH